METEENTLDFQETIDKKTINGLPLVGYEGEIKIINKDADVPAAVEDLRSSRVLGFDTESKPAFRKGEFYLPALLQLGCAGVVYLFQLNQLNRFKELFALLADPEILKVGVAIHDDVKELRQIHEFEPGGFVEISRITRRHGVVNTGLRNLTGMFLNFRISKGAQVSNWSRRHLSPAQVQYAATDAWVSRELYLKLEELKMVDPDEREGGNWP